MGVWLRGSHIGHVVERRNRRVTFRYSDAPLAEFPLNTPLLSCSLRLMRGEQDARPFMAGLLPEGEHRRALAERARVLSDDVFGILARFGQDVAGAVVIGDEFKARPAATAVAYTAETLAAEVSGLADRPLAIHDDSELSIAGLQNKMLLVRTPNHGWARPTHGYPSTHILKLDDHHHPGLVKAEHACLQIVRAAGLEAAESEVTAIAGIDCLIVTRFDREQSADEVPIRIHQEDSCQALGIDLERFGGRAKYESGGGPSLRRIAGLLNDWSEDPRQELLGLLGHVVFTVAIANADAHGKNLSLRHRSPGQLSLAPLYDTVPTALWPTLRTRAAMSVGAAVDMPAIDLTDIVTEAFRWGLPRDLAERHAREVLDRILQATRSIDPSSHPATFDFVSRNVNRLLT